jgi:DNA mismatch repair protein MutL
MLNEKNRIKRLPSLVANQIAAGEVVERPAAVLKELLENSIDAEANNIDITISNGGISLIKITDDGIGIVKEDLELAFAQHATSKINEIADLEKISSLGFRGEAIASIAAVSKLEIISKTVTQPYAYKAELNNNTNNCIIEPYSHPNGTSIIMQNLYYNLPARKKFLRAERTEFLHLEDIFKRIALSNFAVGFKFNYNQKNLYLLKSCLDTKMQAKRVAELCGNYFVQHSNYITVEQNGMKLRGWLGEPKYSKTYADCQYFFINNRLIKDRLIMNVLRKAYKDYLDNNSKHPMYCLYLEIPPEMVDINVHPTKAEVRFREANLVFFFLLHAITEIFKETANNIVTINTSNFNITQNNLIKRAAVDYLERPVHAQNSKINNILCVLDNKIILLEVSNGVKFISIKKLRYNLSLLILQKDFRTNGKITAQPFMLPKRITVKNMAERIILHKDLLFNLGLDCDLLGEDIVVIRTYPKDLEPVENLECLLLDLTAELSKIANNNCGENVLPIIARSVARNSLCSQMQAEQLLQKMNLFSPEQEFARDYAADLTVEELDRLVFG